MQLYVAKMAHSGFGLPDPDWASLSLQCGKIQNKPKGKRLGPGMRWGPSAGEPLSTDKTQLRHLLLPPCAG